MAVYFFECTTCGYDSYEARSLVTTTGDTYHYICPVCAEDNWVDSYLKLRYATDSEIDEIMKK